MSEWEDLETSPRDGSFFIVIDRDGDMYMAYYGSNGRLISAADTTDYGLSKILWYPLPEPPPREDKV